MAQTFFWGVYLVAWKLLKDFPTDWSWNCPRNWLQNCFQLSNKFSPKSVSKLASKLFPKLTESYSKIICKLFLGKQPTSQLSSGEKKMYLEYVYRPVFHIFAIFPWTHYMDVRRLSYLVQDCQGIPQWSEMFFEKTYTLFIFLCTYSLHSFQL